MSLREMRPEDVNFALQLTEAEGWGFARVEIERVQRIDPNGGFIWEGRVPHGFVQTLVDGDTGVVANLVVAEGSRGRKIGRALLDRALEGFAQRGVQSALLYAMPIAVDMYRRRGFQVIRQVRCMTFSKTGRPDNHGAKDCSHMTEDDFDVVQKLDASVFGGLRRRTLEELAQEFPQHCFKCVRSGELRGYVMARTTPLGSDVGPWIARDDYAAERLLERVLASLPPGPVYIGGFADNKHWLTLMKIHGASTKFEAQLMVRGFQRYPQENVHEVYGIAGFELG